MLHENPARAFHYLAAGARLLMQPGLRAFVIVPLLINILIFILLTAWAVNTLTDYYQHALQQNHWLSWLLLIFWLFAGLLALLGYGYTFNLLTTFIAAPFYGVLAEKIEQRLTGQTPPGEAIGSLVVRTFRRELIKLWYFFSRGLLVFLVMLVLFFVPLFGSLVAALLGGIWSAWCMTVQYTDYAADNHRVEFEAMRAQLRRNNLSSLGLGGLVMAGSMIPVVNVFITPLAVAAGTLYWLEQNGESSPPLPGNY